MAWEFNSDKPIYWQIVDIIKFEIIIGKYKNGEKLSSVREFAQEAGVNPNTMQRAFTELERENLVFSERTNGRFVTEDRDLINRFREEYAQNCIEKITKQLLDLGYSKEELLSLLQKNIESEVTKNDCTV
ncbi:MAG: GntR family transcriptional regulator [Epulopiscium sp. Nele67-Bin005]|nr:MAG: GntR family transcriptional regulator [Epulopiscium sp. Nele67-Bin005]